MVLLGLEAKDREQNVASLRGGSSEHSKEGGSFGVGSPEREAQGGGKV